MKKRRMTWEEIGNRALQIGLLFVEIAAATALLSVVSLKVFPIGATECFGWSIVQRALLCYSIYQVLVFLSLSTLNDIQRDSCLALITACKRMKLYCETRDADLKQMLTDRISWNLEPGTLNDEVYRDEYVEMRKRLEKDVPDDDDRHFAECCLIKWEHYYAYYRLQWRYSFLLRFFK